ncbi:MAG: DUF6512 family protein [Bacteroides sp.]|nr:DUF6512 family protein [Bacteroides sp.]MCM1548778.1 DUF6512 family protein [Clostridium sp.]
MKQKQFHLGWVICTTVFAFLLGILFHNIYSWTGNNVFIGLFFPIKESIWEHLKLAFYPLIIIWMLFVHRMHLDPAFLWMNRLTACLVSVIVSFLIITGLYYLLHSGFSLDGPPIHLTAYGTGLFCGQWLAVHLTFQKRIPKWLGITSAILLSLQVLTFACLSLHPLSLPIFQIP